MPNYNAQVPPYSIFPGDVALAFNSEAPAAGQASQQLNRALLNSILGIAGVPPIVVAADDPAAQVTLELNVAKSVAERKSPTDFERGAEKPASSAGATIASVSSVVNRAVAARGMKSVAAPMRRRSWHQIYRILEIDAARKKEAV